MFRFCARTIRSDIVIKLPIYRDYAKLEIHSQSRTNPPQNLVIKSSSKPLIVVNQCNWNQLRYFRTSQSYQSPKLLLIFVRPIVAIVTGRLFRQWWQKKDHEEKMKYLNWFNRNKSKIWTCVGVYFASVISYYFYNIEETPFTGRKRFMAFTTGHLNDINKTAAVAMIQGFPAMNKSHPYVKRVVNTAQRIVRANKDIKEFNGIEWRVSVLDQPGIINALVTGDGQIIVFKDIIEQCVTDDELAIVLAHEMAHAVMNHVAEKLSNTWLIGFFTAPFLAIIWALTPSDLFAALLTYIHSIVMNFVIEFPFSRYIESEADMVGLRFAAKACVDVRQAVSLWKRMDATEKERSGLPPEAKIPSVIEYFGTHPTHERRWRSMEGQLEAALEVRESCGCYPLGSLPAELSKNLVIEKMRDKALHVRII